MNNRLKKHPFYLFCFFIVATTISCNNDLKEIQELNKKRLVPSGVAERINVKYTDSAKIKAILETEKMLDYTNVKFPFSHFPKKVKITVFNEGKKHIITADKATAYNKSGIINLQGNIKIKSEDGRVMETQQLYYDQKNNWFFTESYFKISDKNNSYFEGIGVDFDSNLNMMNTRQNKGSLASNE